MRLNKEEKVDFKKLRISNFKSFVDPVEVNIGKGLTGVVGPNGCGKSNLVEALRWAIGLSKAMAKVKFGNCFSISLNSSM